MTNTIKNDLALVKSKLQDTLSEVVSPNTENKVIEQNLNLLLRRGDSRTINVIQAANVKQEVIINLVEVIKAIDQMEQIVVVEDPVDKVCEHFFSLDLGMIEVQVKVKKAYIEYVLRNKFRKNNEAAKFLKVRPNYLSKCKKELGIECL